MILVPLCNHEVYSQDKTNSSIDVSAYVAYIHHYPKEKLFEQKKFRCHAVAHEFGQAWSEKSGQA